MPLSLIEESLPVALLCKIHVNAERVALEFFLKAGRAYAGIGGAGLFTLARTVGAKVVQA